jgi:4-oxalocrotonate tautomerase
MPIATIHLLEGRDKELKHKLIKNVSHTIVETLDCQPESVRVILQEMNPDHYGVAGLPVMEYRVQKGKELKK